VYGFSPGCVIAKPGQGPIIFNFHVPLHRPMAADLEERGGAGLRVAQKWSPLPVVGARIVLRSDEAHTRGLRPVS